MENDLISVIVPTYNIQDYIENTVNSICGQKYQNLEIILVDDGSQDNTPRILDRLSEEDNRIVVVHKENGGVTSARLEGVRVASGEWIGFVDGDDYIEPEMYQVLVDNVKKYDATIAHCGYQMVFPSRIDFYYNTGRLVEQDNKAGIKDLLEGSFIEPGLWNKLFHRSLFDNLLYDNVMDMTIKNNEDLLMNYFLFKEADKSVYIDKCYYHYMIRNGSAATSELNENKLCDPIKVLKIISLDIYDDLEIQNIVENRIITTLINLATIPIGKRKELIRPHKISAKKELRSKLPQIMKNKFSLAIKIKAVWVSICPISYEVIHRFYMRITGIDRKYDVG